MSSKPGFISFIRLNLFDFTNYFLLVVLCAAMLYPFLYVFSASISDPVLVMKNEILLLPRKITLHAYWMIFEKLDLERGFFNSTLYTVVGTGFSIFMTSLTAYALSRKEMAYRIFFTKMVTFTMFFSGGLIPTYLVVRYLGMIDRMWALVIPAAISTWNLLVMRTFFAQVSESIIESARIDGSNDLAVLFRIIFPLSIPAIATIGLFYAVEQWNSFFPALIYLNTKEKFPLQLMIRYIAVQGSTNDIVQNISNIIWYQNIKYAVLLVSSLPIICVYPFIQRYFVKGVTIGSLKE